MRCLFQAFSAGLLILSNAATAFAHGEDRLGPHKGYVRMPSNYHTEVLTAGSNRLKVYLLDISWRNPSVKDSSVQIMHRSSTAAAKNTPAQCEIKGSYYLCTFPRGINLRRAGTLVVNSQREGQKGIEVSYALPLRLEKSTPPPAVPPAGADEHGGHH